MESMCGILYEFLLAGLSGIRMQASVRVHLHSTCCMNANSQIHILRQKKKIPH